VNVRAVAVVVGTALGSSACSRSDPPAASQVAAVSKPEWRVECRPVLDDRHQACYGPGRDAGPRTDRFDFYQVSVERKRGAELSDVLFVKRLAIADVDAKFLDASAAAEVVRYDAATRSVRFDLGREPIVYPMEAKR
jgi:hypothetical protein